MNYYLRITSFFLSWFFSLTLWASHHPFFSPQRFKALVHRGQWVEPPNGGPLLPRKWAFEFEFGSPDSLKDIEKNLLAQGTFEKLFLDWGPAAAVEGPTVVEPLAPHLCGSGEAGGFMEVWKTGQGWSFWARPNIALLGPAPMTPPQGCRPHVQTPAQRWVVWKVPLNPQAPTTATLNHVTLDLNATHMACLGVATCQDLAATVGSPLARATPLGIIEQKAPGMPHELLGTASTQLSVYRQALRGALAQWQTHSAMADEPTPLHIVTPLAPVLVGPHGVPGVFKEDGSVTMGMDNGWELNMGHLWPHELEAGAHFLKALSKIDTVWVSGHPQILGAGLHIHLDIPEAKEATGVSWVPHLPRLWQKVFKPFLKDMDPLQNSRAIYVHQEMLYRLISRKFPIHDPLLVFLGVPVGRKNSEPHWHTWKDVRDFLYEIDRDNGLYYRRCGLNPLSLLEHGTLELRWFNAAFAPDLSLWLEERLQVAYALLGALQEASLSESRHRNKP